MARRLIILAEQEQLTRLSEVCFALEQDLERLESASAAYDSNDVNTDISADTISQLSASKAALGALLRRLLARLPA